MTTGQETQNINYFYEAVKIILPVLGGGFLAILVNYFSNRQKNKHLQKMEYIKIFAKDKLDAYKELQRFSVHVETNLFPLSDNKAEKFRDIMGDEYEHLVVNRLYYSNEIRGIIDRYTICYVYICNPELLAEMEYSESDIDFDNFIKNEAFDHACRLQLLVNGEVNKYANYIK